MSLETLTTISPITNKGILTRAGLSPADLDTLPTIATEAFLSFRKTSLADRQAIVKKALKILDSKQDELAKELTEQMGRPIAYTAKEVTTAVMRGEHLLKISEDALKDTEGEPEKGFKRFIRKVPVGPVLVLFAWNVSTENDRHQANAYIVTVPIPHSCQFPYSCSACWELCYPQAFTPNTYDCRAHVGNLPRSRTAKECHTILPLRLATYDRIYCAKPKG